ncbi:SGNH/GDSL hydrolase family protein [Microbacterium sp. DT81.1]|uniref:SGNH/GDSL hydrolase family protein n=1 Tax=Microbacterium sp. DT81.1 TaxID=3393413 RepID=UPI003CF7857A
MHPIPEDGTVALFIGDSITDYYRRTSEYAPLGSGFVRRIAERARDAGTGMTVVNRGIAGNRVRDLRRRWTEDCLSIAPSVLTVLIGINDTARRYDEADPTSTADFKADYASILDQAQRASALDRLVLMEPFLVPFTADQARWHEEDLDEKIAVVRDLASRFDAELIPLDTILAQAAASQGARTLLADGIHPTDAGNELLAHTWWEAAKH